MLQDLAKRIPMVERTRGKLVTMDGRTLYEGEMWLEMVGDGGPRTFWRAGFEFERSGQLTAERANYTLHLEDGRTGLCHQLSITPSGITLQVSGGLA